MILPPEAYHDGSVNVHSHLKDALCTLAVPTLSSAREERAALLEGEEVIGDEALASALMHRVRVQHARQHLDALHLHSALLLANCTWGTDVPQLSVLRHLEAVSTGTRLHCAGPS